MNTDFCESPFRAFERDGYSRVAAAYANKTAKVTGQANEAILNAVHAGAGTHLLDVACGPGLLTAAALERGAVVKALDFAPNMVAQARSLNPGADVIEGDAENLPFDDGQFDAVVCSLGVLHFAEPERAMVEVFRTLKPGGRYAFTCWTPPTVNPFMGLILGSIEQHGTLDLDLPAGPPLFRFGDPRECEAVLREVGFTETAVTEAALIWPCASTEELLRELPTSTARLGPLLDGQTKPARQKIESAIAAGAKKFTTERGIAIPSPVLVASGLKP